MTEERPLEILSIYRDARNTPDLDLLDLLVQPGVAPAPGGEV